MGAVEVRRRAAWRFVRAIVRSQAGGVVGAVLSGLLWQTGAIAAPLIVSYTIDHGIVPRDRHTLVVWLLALLGVGLLEVVAGGMRHIYAIRNRSATDARVRDAIFAHALRLDASYHDRVGPGELMSRASSDSEHVARMMDAIGHTVGYALTVVAVSIVMLVVDAKLALLVLLPLPFVSVVAWLYSRRYDERTRRLQEAWAGAATLVEESVSGIRVVKGLGAGGALSGRFRSRSDEIVGRALDVARLDAVFNPALEVLPLIGIAAVVWVGGRQVMSGGLSLGLFVAFNAYVVMLVWPLRVLGQRVSPLQKALAACARASRSRSSARLAPGRARSPASSRGSTIRTAAASSSTAMTSVSCGSPTCARRSRSSSRRPSSSRRACARTSASAVRTPTMKRLLAPPRWPVRRSSSRDSRTGTRRCSASGASRCPADSASGSRSRARSSRIRRCSSSTMRPPPSTRRRK